MTYAALYANDRIPQTAPLDARQVANSAGGFVYELDTWARLDRFLILGSDAPTYYVSAPKLTRDNAGVVVQCWSSDAARTAARLTEISTEGRAPKESPTLFALALGELHEDAQVRAAARAAVPAICRTASQMMEYVATVQALGRGWGRGFKRSIANWYEARTPDDLGHQMSKYRVRNGLDHARLIKSAHPAAVDRDATRRALYMWGIGRSVEEALLPDYVRGHLAAMAATSSEELASIIARHGLTWEAIPTSALKDAGIWTALLPNLPMKAMLRNLSTLASVGLLSPLSDAAIHVVSKLEDERAVRRSRLHPYAILQAMAVFRSGRSVKGDRTWPVNARIVEALAEAFHLAFANVEPTGKRHLFGLDVSGSMQSSLIGGVVSAREASAALAMVAARKEKAHAFIGFGHGVVDLDIGPSMRLDEVIGKISGLPFQATDCSLPMLHALERGIPVDVFQVYTDNETYAGRMHPSEALKKYRRETGIDAKLIVVGMTSTGFSIADPLDAGMLDVVGFDSKAVSAMADFVRT